MDIRLKPVGEVSVVFFSANNLTKIYRQWKNIRGKMTIAGIQLEMLLKLNRKYKRKQEKF